MGIEVCYLCNPGCTLVLDLKLYLMGSLWLPLSLSCMNPLSNSKTTRERNARKAGGPLSWFLLTGFKSPRMTEGWARALPTSRGLQEKCSLPVYTEVPMGATISSSSFWTKGLQVYSFVQDFETGACSTLHK